VGEKRGSPVLLLSHPPRIQSALIVPNRFDISGRAVPFHF
jgi:hypothetical protein